MSEQGEDLEARLPPIVPRIRAVWRDARVVFIFPDQQELAYTLDEVDGIYTMLHQHRRLLAGASYSILPSPDGKAYCRLSGEGAVLLLAELRAIRHQLGLPDPADDPLLTDDL